MLEHYVVACVHHLLRTYIVGVFAGEREGVALFEVHVSERFYRVGFLKEVGTVAPQLCAGVREVNLAAQYLCIGHRSIHVVGELIGVYEVHALVGSLSLLFALWCRRSPYQAEAKKA